MIYDVFNTVTLTYIARDLKSFDAACAILKPNCEVWEMDDSYNPVASYSFQDGKPAVKYNDAAVKSAAAEM